MTDNKNNNHADLLAHTTDIVSAYLASNKVDAADIQALIERTYKTLSGIGASSSGHLGERPQPAVPIKKSVTPDYIVCLEDGKKLKMLKRHLKSAYNLTPEAYRERWGLPSDYPMVAPNYATKRSTLAKSSGLGKTRKKA